jgi:hypothetical protein
MLLEEGKMLLEINPSQAACLEEYAQETGKTPDECVEEALDDWIRVIAPAIYQTEKFNVVAFLPALSN